MTDAPETDAQGGLRAHAELGPYAVYEDAQAALDAASVGQWDGWTGTAILELFFGLCFVRKVARLINRVYAGNCTRAIWVGPRGGGKSQTDALIEFLLWFFKNYDVVNVGGSETQAANVYAYLQGFMQQYRDFYAETQMGGQAPSLALTKETMSRTVKLVDQSRLHVPRLYGEDGQLLPPEKFSGPPMAKDSKAFIAVLAASQKQVRGPHAGSEKRGGALIIDEEAEVAADISTASRYIVNTAIPSVIIRTSTNHNSIGTFAEDVEDPDAKGLELYRTSIFDMTHTCPYAVTTEAQWEAIDVGEARAPGDEHFLVRHLPVMQPDCAACPRPQWFRDVRERVDSATGIVKEVKAPLCGGAAAFAENGYIPFDGPDGVLAQFDQSPSIEEFEVELCGSAPSTTGLVIKDRDSLAKYSPDRRTRAVVPDAWCVWVPLHQGGGEVLATIDWGLAGTCAVNLLQNRLDMNSPIGRRVVLKSVNLGKQSDSVVYDQMEDWREEYGLAEIWADASHPYNNYNLTLRGFNVTAVEFAKQKAFGVGSINGHLENDALWIPEEEGRELIKQLKGWRKSETGQIVKKDDHFPDSLLCGLLKYRELVLVSPSMAASRERRAALEANDGAAVVIPTGAHSMNPARAAAMRDAGRLDSGKDVGNPRVVGGDQRRSVVNPMPRGRTVATASATRGRAIEEPRISVPAVQTVSHSPVPSTGGPPEKDSAPPGETTMQRIMREAREKADQMGGR